MKKIVFLDIGIAIITIFILKLQNKDLHSVRINGRIDKYHYFLDKHDPNKCYAVINVNKTEYKIIATPVPGNEFEFLDVTRVGDTVFKYADNDTLIITRTGYDDDAHYPYIVKKYKGN